MPELPELEVIKQRLIPLVVGKSIKGLSIIKPYVLKSYFNGDLNGETIEGITRRGKYLEFQLTSHKIYIHLMLYGSVAYIPPSVKPKKSATALLFLENGASIEFSENTKKKRMAVYIKPKNEIPTSIENLGLEPLSQGFTMEELDRLLKSEAKQLKSLLCRQSMIAGIGNAYADEILWNAGLSPFKLSTNLSKQETKKLHRAIIEVLKWAIQAARHSKRLDKRDFLQIHGRKGRPCPRCGDTISTVSFAQSDTFYCPKCQTGGRKLKDRRMSRFYR
jgi:formamidopyrimidine-DNA glycosylase